MQGVLREKGKSLRVWITALVLGVPLLATQAKAEGEPGLYGSLKDIAVHGYIDNFTILRNDNSLKTITLPRHDTGRVFSSLGRCGSCRTCSIALSTLSNCVRSMNRSMI